MTNNLLLTKSDFLLFLEAPRHLWAEKHGLLNSTPSAFDSLLMKQGYEVEALAKDYLESFVLEQDQNLICQKTFTEGQYTVRTDFLVHKPMQKSCNLYEVKSGTSIKKENIYDVAYQFLVVKKEIEIDRVFILHLNGEYTRHSTLNLADLFTAEDVTAKVPAIVDEVNQLRETAPKTTLSPSPDGIAACLNPKTCPCPDICHPGLPEYSIFDIPRLSAKQKVELESLGILDIKNVPKSFALNAKQRQIVDVAQSNQDFIDREAIRKEFQQFVFPLYFLDYETYLSAIPMYDGYHPQQQMVFQYSLHKMYSIDGEIHHSEHLAITKDDPSKSLIKQLREDIGNTGTIFVWNKSFEMGRNKELAVIHPEYADFFADINERIYDLGDFINLGFYLNPRIKGSWSIKNVLPVMVPELSYDEMEIGQGEEAMLSWWKVINGKLTTEEAEKTKTALLEYCKLDTFAMVRIFQTLSSMI